jgi:hypothetical protein
MRIAEELTTRLHDKGNDETEPSSEVLIAGKSSGIVVPGAILEAAVLWDDYFLLFMTDDVPDEEMLRVLLLDDKLYLVDSVTIGSPYSTGSFSSLQLSPPNSVSFRFIGDCTWEIELLSKPGFRIPFFSEPRGVWRSFGFKRHFIVHGSPRPQDSLAS